MKQNISQKKQNLEHQKQMEGVCCLQLSVFFCPLTTQRRENGDVRSVHGRMLRTFTFFKRQTTVT